MALPFSLSQILDWTRGRVANPEALAGLGGEATVRVSSLAPLDLARAGSVAFFFNPSYQSQLPTAQPTVLITGEPFVAPLQASGLSLWSKCVVVACADPYSAMAILSAHFAAELSSVAHRAPSLEGASVIHPTAVVDATAQLGPGVRVGAHCVIEAGVQIGAGTQLYSGCVVGPHAQIGECGVLFANAVIYENVQIGDRVRIHANTTIGSDGFGYAASRSGSRVTGHQKIYHLGRVVIGNDVEIGANCSIDRGTLGETRIDSMAKLDNQVHVGHNAHVGEGAILCGGICLAGNARIGKFAYVGGMTGVVNEIVIGDGAMVGAMSLITKDIEAGGKAVGNPQRESREHFKVHAKLNQLLKEPRTRKSKSV